MSPILLAIRAVSSEFARRIYLPLVFVIGAVFLALILFGAWLTTLDAWGWLLLVPIILLTLVYVILSTVVGLIINLLRPTQTKAQRKQVSELVDKLQEVSEGLQLPKALLVFQLIKDTIKPSGKGFVGKMTSNAVSLKPDFQRLIASFK